MMFEHGSSERKKSTICCLHQLGRDQRKQENISLFHHPQNSVEMEVSLSQYKDGYAVPAL